MADPRRTIDNAISEAAFQQQILELAKLTGWRRHHGRPAQNRSGQWSTPIQGDPGFPDLILAHPDGLVVAAELKTARGKETPEQSAWLHVLDSAELYAACWRPRDWLFIQQVLTRRLT